MNPGVAFASLPHVAPGWRGRAVTVLAISLLAHFAVLTLGRDALRSDEGAAGQERVIAAALHRLPAAPAVATPPAARVPRARPAAVPKPRPRPQPKPRPMPEPAAEPVAADVVTVESPPMPLPLPLEPPAESFTSASEPVLDPLDSVKEAPPMPAVTQTVPNPQSADSAASGRTDTPAPRGPITGEFDASGATLTQALADAPLEPTALPVGASYSYDTADTRFAGVTGKTSVSWRRSPDGSYAASLKVAVFGIPALELNSGGRIDAFGLAPERYTEKTVGRSAWATSFDWANTRVTFSRKPHERELRTGMQDRLSFQFQMMALGERLLTRLQPGATLVLGIGGRDDTTRYRLQVIGPERIETPAGSYDTIKFDKQSSPQDGARIELWLAPQSAWLAVKLRFTDRKGEVTENVLSEIQPASAPSAQP